MYNSNDLAISIKNRAKKQNVQINKLLSDIGLGRNVISHLKGGSMLKADSLANIADYLECSVDFLLGRTDNPEINRTPVFQAEEKNIIRIPLASNKASAGTGYYLLDNPDDIIDIDANIYPKADLAVDIYGDSMEPRYHNADRVLIHKQPYIDNGQVGIFMLKGDGYIKKYHKDYNGVVTLVSLNPDYDDIIVAPSDDFTVVGRVLYIL